MLDLIVERFGTPGRTRTYGLELRSLLLYPAELPGLFWSYMFCEMIRNTWCGIPELNRSPQFGKLIY
jgi:hypothetical protein